MKIKHVFSKKKNRGGFRFRFRDPRTGRPTEKTFWVNERQSAERLFRRHVSELEERKHLGGAVSSEAWATRYTDLVKRFLGEAILRSDARRLDLQRVLEANDLGVKIAADLNDRGALEAKARRLAADGTRSAVYLMKVAQPALKQLSRWAWKARLLPANPLADWDTLPLGHEPERRRSYTVDEARAILAAAAELDALHAREYPSELVLRTLLTCGNRPGAMFAAKVSDLENDRVRLPAGNGNKKNGKATLPPELVAELRAVNQDQKGSALLLRSSEGNPLEKANFAKRTFAPAAILAFVRMAWPHGDPATAHADPAEVAAVIHQGRPFKADGRRPTTPAKVEALKLKTDAIDTLAGKLRDTVLAKLKARPLYAFVRHSHETLARAVAKVHPDAVGAQIGHTGGGVAEKHYLDAGMLDPSESSRAVYDLLRPKVQRQDQPTRSSNVVPLAKAAGAESLSENEVQCEVGGESATRTGTAHARKSLPDNGVPGRTRTCDLRFRNGSGRCAKNSLSPCIDNDLRRQPTASKSD